MKTVKVFLFGGAINFSKDGSKEGVGKAYNVGNDFFRHMLGKSFQYTCAIFRTKEDTLDQAQQHKMDVIIQKLQLTPDHKVLDIGCGWGTLLNEIHKKHGSQVTGIALAKEQIKYCQETHSFGKFEYLDYRDLQEQNHYDRVVSVGMIEHVGREYWQAYVDKVVQILKPNGRALLHTMVRTSHSMKSLIPDKKEWLFTDQILPCSCLPSDSEFIEAIQKTGKLRIVHQEKFGVHYAETLRRWTKNMLDQADEIKKTHPPYLLRAYEYAWAMIGSFFATGGADLWQVVVEKSYPTMDAPVYDPRAQSEKPSEKKRARQESLSSTNVNG